MKKTTIFLIAAIIGIVFVAYLYTGYSSEPPSCIVATRENGRYDVNNDGVVNFQDSGLIYTNSIEGMGDDYVYDVLYDMNCDGVVDGVDVDLCWENRD